MRRRGLHAAAVAALVVLLGQPALAAPAGDVRSVTETAPDQVQVLFAADGLGADQQLQPESVSVTADGRPLTVTATTAASATSESPTAFPSVMLALDTSGSMAGERIVQARSAASAYVDRLPADVAVGVTTFAEQARVLVPLTKDRSVVRTALSSITAKGGTSLYDGVLAASAALGATGERRLLLVSDGADSTSRATLGEAVEQVRLAKVVVNAVRLGDDAAADEALRRITAAGTGKVVSTADAAALDSALAQAGRQRVTSILATVEVPSDLAGSKVPLRITVLAGAQRLAASEIVVLPGRLPATQASAPESFFDTQTGYRVGALAVGLALLLLTWLFLNHREETAGDGGRTKQLLAMYTLRSTEPVEPDPVDQGVFSSPLARRALDLAERFNQRRGLEERTGVALERAGIALRPAEWLLLRAAIGMVLLVLLFLVTGNLLVALLVGVVAGGLIPAMFLRVKIKRRQREFVAGLPDALQLVAGSLSAGYSLPQALDAVVREGTQPIAGELGRAMAESRLGVPVEDALDTVAERMAVDDFRWVVMAIRVQREVGGNLAGVLTTVTTTMRERAKLRRTIRALSAEGRLSAYVLVGLPIGISLFMLAFRRDYMRPLYTETAGIVMLVFAILMVLAGSAFMAKLVKVEA